MIPIRPGDVAAVVLHPSDRWPALVEDIWSAGGAVLPIDHRLPAGARQALVVRARPAALFDGAWWPVEHAEPVGEGAALVMATSGTEGEPKLAVLSHDAVRHAVEASARRLDVDPADPWLACLPPAHIGGLLVVLRAVLLGSPLVVHRWFDVEHFATADARYTSLVPTMIARLAESGVDLSRYRAILAGGAATPRTLVERAGTRIVQTYGLTESCGGVVYDGVPLDGVEIRLAGDDEIQLRGPTLMREYLRENEQPFTADGWLRTRDAGTFDADGRLTHVERLDDVIVSGGEKIHPTRVEDVLREHPGVADVAIVGRPDDEWGSRAIALVVPRGDEVPQLDDLRAFVAERLPRYMAPREVRVVESLPRTGSGKLRRALLRPRGDQSR